MKKSILLNLTLVALGAGFLCGFWSSRHFSDPNERGLEMDRQTDKADVALRALKGLREGNTNTMPFLENELDVSIVLLGAMVAETPVRERGQTELQTLGKIRDYRAKFPHKSNQPGFDEEIARAFSILDEKH